MGLEVITIVLIVLVISAKWLTTFHTQKLGTRLASAENTCRRNEKRFRAVHEERKQLAESTNEIKQGAAAIDTAIQELTEELVEIEKRNSEIQEQISESKK